MESPHPSGTDVRVYQIKYAERELRMSDAFHGFEELGVADRELLMDYNFWLVRKGDQTVLVDTGYTVADRDWLGEVDVLPPREGLALLDIRPEEVDLVVLTHFHFDHIGCLPLFTNARVVCARREYDFWMGKLKTEGLAHEFTTPEMLAAVEHARVEGRLDFVESFREVLPGLSVELVGGHCPGELLVTVETPKGTVVLAADAAHYYLQVEHGWPFFAHVDLDEMLAGLARLREMQQQSGVQVIPGHDPEVRRRYPPASGKAGQVVTVLA